MPGACALTDGDAVPAWAASGAMRLSGRPGQPALGADTGSVLAAL